LWARNRSGPGAADGYEVGADDINEILGQLRNLLQALGGDVSGTVGTELSDAMSAVLSTKLEADDLPAKGSFDDMTALQTAYPTAEAGHWAILQNGISGNASVAIWDADNDPAGWVDTAAPPSSVDWSAVANKPARIGPTTEVVADYDSATSTGWYSAASGAANQPAAINALIEVIAFDTNNLVQIATDRASDATYYRRREAGSWGSWTQTLATIATSVLDGKQAALGFTPANSTVTVTGSGLASGGGDLSANRVISVVAATIAEIRAGVAAVATSVANLYASLAEVTIDNIAAWDTSAGTNFNYTLTSNVTLNASVFIVGKSGRIRFVQDATGNRTLGFQAGDFEYADATPPSINLAANAVTYIWYEVTASGKIFLSAGAQI